MSPVSENAVPEGKIILVRHGETDANRRKCLAESDDIPLTETGRRQSEFARTRKTSDIIAGVLGLYPEIIPGIHECNFGFLKGHSYAWTRSDTAPSQP
jgi:broad specificity phosphatase PhoE